MLLHLVTDAWNQALGSVPGDWWFWIWIAGYAIGGVLLLWVLNLIKNIAGWPGVGAALLAVLYAFGFLRGKSGASINPFDNKPKPPQTRRKK